MGVSTKTTSHTMKWSLFVRTQLGSYIIFAQLYHNRGKLLVYLLLIASPLFCESTIITIRVSVFN